MQIPKVLLVNDDAPSLFARDSVLIKPARNCEYELVTASSGHEALRQVLMHELAVILLDVNMPGTRNNLEPAAKTEALSTLNQHRRTGPLTFEPETRSGHPSHSQKTRICQ
ncbi:MAG: response regulator [Massilia sp.]|nr:response regulator [Massilia sp.]